MFALMQTGRAEVHPQVCFLIREVGGKKEILLYAQFIHPALNIELMRIIEFPKQTEIYSNL